jgi:hypothetical protein
MKTASVADVESVAADIMADLEAVCDAAAAGKKIDPQLRKRIDERADKVRDAIFREHGVLDIGVPIIRELRDAE